MSDDHSSSESKERGRRKVLEQMMQEQKDEEEQYLSIRRKTIEITNEDIEERDKQLKEEEQRRSIQKNQDHIIEQLFQFQRMRVLDDLQKKNDISDHSLHEQLDSQNSSGQKYIYSDQKQSDHNEEAWWIHQHDREFNSPLTIKQIEKEKDAMQIYSVGLRLLCEKFKRKYSFEFKEMEDWVSNCRGSNPRIFFCEVILDGVKLGVVSAKSKKDAKTLAAKRAVERLMGINGEKLQKQFLENFFYESKTRQERMGTIILQKEQLLNELEEDEDTNFREELSIFAHKCLRKPVAWETVFDQPEKKWFAMVRVGNLTEQGFGKSKKIAKNLAALKLLKRCQSLSMKEEIINKKKEKKQDKKQKKGEGEKGKGKKQDLQKTSLSNCVIEKINDSNDENINTSNISILNNSHNNNNTNQKFEEYAHGMKKIKLNDLKHEVLQDYQ